MTVTCVTQRLFVEKKKKHRAKALKRADETTLALESFLC